MATRAAIVRPTENGFVGAYHHWDGYPSGLGATLFALAQPDSPFDGDLDRLLATLIDEHPAGWSTINGADWSLDPGCDESDNYDCTTCGEPAWKHWIQNYQSRGLETPEPFTPGKFQTFDHSPVRPETPKRPNCYCHGDRSEPGWVVTNENASGSGVEWAYLIDAEARTMTVLSSYIDGGALDGAKMVGFFGAGDPDAVWKPVAVIDLSGEEPDWQQIEDAS